MTTHETPGAMTSAFDEGIDAYQAGKTPSSNPYDKESDNHIDWEDGFRSALEGDE